MEDFLMEFEELEELGLTNEFVIKSHKTAEMLRIVEGSLKVVV